MENKQKIAPVILDKIKPSLEDGAPIATNEIELIPDSRQGTAKKVIKILVELNQGYMEPNKKERVNLVIAFAKRNKVIYGKAFDIVKIKDSKKINLENIEDIERNLADITIYEVKSTNKKDLKPSFDKYFFLLLSYWWLKT